MGKDGRDEGQDGRRRRVAIGGGPALSWFPAIRYYSHDQNYSQVQNYWRIASLCPVSIQIVMTIFEPGTLGNNSNSANAKLHKIDRNVYRWIAYKEENGKLNFGKILYLVCKDI